MIDRRRKKFAKLKLSIGVKFHGCPKSVAQFGRNMFKVMAQQSGGGSHVVSLQIIINLSPYIPVVPLSWAEVYIPRSELNGSPSTDQPFGFHVP